MKRNPTGHEEEGLLGAADGRLPNTPSIVAATQRSLADLPQALARARTFAEPLIAFETLDTGENTLAHADAVAKILKIMGGS